VRLGRRGGEPVAAIDARASVAGYVERLRASAPDRDVPHFDPTQASTDARVVLLLEAPGRRGATVRRGSGFISPDNDDATAENT